MATLLDKELKRQVTVGGAAYVVAIDPDGLRLTGKGRRKAEVALRWRDLLSGDAAMAVALNASLATKATSTKPTTTKPPRTEQKAAAPPPSVRTADRASRRTAKKKPPSR